MSNPHLQVISNMQAPDVDVLLTERSLNFFCSRLRTAINRSRSAFFLSSYSAACIFNLACCFFSISARRFCALDDELCERVPSRAPNSLCPRFRSSALPLTRRSSRMIEVAGPGRSSSGGLSSSTLLSRRSRLVLLSEPPDCRRLAKLVGEGSFSASSGTTTAEATTLDELYVSRSQKIKERSTDTSCSVMARGVEWIGLADKYLLSAVYCRKNLNLKFTDDKLFRCFASGLLSSR